MFLKLLKRIVIFVSVIILLLLITIITVPFFIDIDKYRPQILEMVNSNINGTLNIKKLSLSLWGKIEIKIDDMSLVDASKKEIFSTKRAYLLLPFYSVFHGSPYAIFRINNPQFIITKSKNGQLNVLTLIKPPSNIKDINKRTMPLQQKQNTDKKQDIDLKNTKLYALLARAHVDIEILDAIIKFNDYSLGFKQELNGLNLKLQDVSITKPMRLNIWSDVNTKFSDMLSMQGKLDINGQIQPKFDGINFISAVLSLMANMDNMDIKVQNILHKSKNIPLNFQLRSTVFQDQLDLENLVFNFNNICLTAKATVKGLQNALIKINADIKSNDIQLQSLETLIPMLKPMGIDGTIKLSARAKGPLNKDIYYDAKLKASNIGFKVDALSSKPKLNLSMELSKDNITKFIFKFLAPNNDLIINLKANSLITSPVINVDAVSNSIDIDSLLSDSYKGKLKSASQTPLDTSTKISSSVKVSAKDTKDFVSGKQQGTSSLNIDQYLEPLRTNDYIKKILLSLNFNVKKFKVFNLEMKDIFFNFNLKDLVASIEKFYMKIWAGEILVKSYLDIKPKMPTYALDLDIKNLNVQHALASQFKFLSNTAMGTLSIKATGNGKSLNFDQILPQLKLDGSFAFVDFKFATIDIGKIFEEGINQVIVKNSQKIPGIKDKQVGLMKNYKMRFSRFSSKFKLQSGIVDINNTEIIAYPNEGVDIKGTTKVDLLQDKISASWEIIDTYNITKVKELSVSYNGIIVNNILVEPNKPFIFPIKIGCKLSLPCYDYKDAVERLTKIALKNIERSVTNIIKKEPSKITDQLQKIISPKSKKNVNSISQPLAIPQKSLDKIKDKAKDLKKKFGF